MVKEEFKSNDTISISIMKANRALQALQIIDQGFEKLDDKGEKIKQSYKFPVITTWALADLMINLEDALRSFNKIRDEEIKRISGGKGMIDANNREQIAEFGARTAELQDQLININFIKISRDSLHIGNGEGQNVIPYTLLAGLIPFVSD